MGGLCVHGVCRRDCACMGWVGGWVGGRAAFESPGPPLARQARQEERARSGDVWTPQAMASARPQNAATTAAPQLCPKSVVPPPLVPGRPQDGYNVGDLPANEEALIQQVLQQSEARYNSADLNIAYKMVGF